MRSLLRSHMEWGWDYPFAGSLFRVMKVSFQRGPTTKVARCFNLLCQLNRGMALRQRRFKELGPGSPRPVDRGHRMGEPMSPVGPTRTSGYVRCHAALGG